MFLSPEHMKQLADDRIRELREARTVSLPAEDDGRILRISARIVSLLFVVGIVAIVL